ncbi:AraC family transcriptional regulator [Acidocella facilis]|uniref:AraC family transcriptional regulator n=1 Tax=Acidocella facilis TaxID=525 RepID=UPI00047EEAE1|nr:helix-turn-helix transcriptional regulator [Acidocella facilis]
MRALSYEETQNALTAHGLDQPRGIGFAFLDPARNVFYDWHTHEYHQLIYAVDGPTQIETEAGRYILPQGRAAWIPAGARHRTLITAAVGVSLYFSPTAVADPTARVKILAASPLMREMIVFSARWGLGAPQKDVLLATSFLQTLALLCGQWLESELPLFLPGATHPPIRRAMDYAASDLSAATQTGALAAAGLSERSFRRLFARDTGLTWQSWLGQARIMMAMGLLSEGRRVTEVAAEVGYSSLSAFAKAFAQLAGEGPSQFRHRHSAAAKPEVS